MALISRSALAEEPLAPYADVLREWLDSHRADAVLIRPDRYVFGAGDAYELKQQWHTALRAA